MYNVNTFKVKLKCICEGIICNKKNSFEQEGIKKIRVTH